MIMIEYVHYLKYMSKRVPLREKYTGKYFVLFKCMYVQVQSMLKYVHAHELIYITCTVVDT